jgi:hypothetical protein
VRRLALLGLLVTTAASAIVTACSLFTGVDGLREVACDSAGCAQEPDASTQKDSASGTALDAAPDVTRDPTDAKSPKERDAPLEPIVCEAGMTACGGACAALDDDPENCGACAHSCLGGECITSACQPVTLATLPAPVPIAVSKTQVYVASLDEGYVASLPLTGGTAVTLAPDEGSPRHIAADSNFVYWCDESSGTVRRSTPDGSTIVTLASGQLTPWALTVDATDVYWTNGFFSSDAGTGPTVLSCALGGCGGVPTVVYSDTVSSRGIGLVGASVLWAEPYSDKIVTCPKTGCPASGPTAVAAGQSGATSIATDGVNLFWQDDGIGSLMMCAASACTTPTMVASGISTTGAYGNAVAADSARVYWADQTLGTVFGCATTGCTTPTILATAQGDVAGIAVDDVAVYWTSYSLGTVSKVAK